MFENLNYTPDLLAGLWITGIVCFVSVVFPALLYWALQINLPFANSSPNSKTALSATKGV